MGVLLWEEKVNAVSDIRREMVSFVFGGARSKAKNQKIPIYLEGGEAKKP